MPRQLSTQSIACGRLEENTLCTLLSSEKTADMPDDEVLAAVAEGPGALGWNKLPGGGGGGAAGPPLEGAVSQTGSLS